MTDVETNPKMNKDLDATEEGVVVESSDESASYNEDVVKKNTKQKNHEEKEDFDLERFPVRQVEFILPGFKEALAFNPVVSGIGVFFLWGIAIWSMIDPDGSNELLVDWRAQVTFQFTWLFVGMRAIFFLFLVYTAYRFGGVRLGRQDEEPEFSTGAYFMMIFAAGMAVGLFVYGVTEPLYHTSGNFFTNAGYHSQDEISLWAINMTVTNSAIAGWAPYLIVAVGMGLAGHRFGLPLTFRSCFYPILGEYTWGWLGDVADGYAIVTTVAGVCTSLGLGAIQITAGFQYLGWVDEDIPQTKESLIQNLTIWAITAVATASVISGVHAGIQFLSQFAFMLSVLLLFMVLMMDNTKHLLNLFVQECGYFLQHSLLEMNFWTDAYAQLDEGSGRATDGNAGGRTFMNNWVIFYQAWWTAWACFVGLFVARISRGRTVAEVITYSMVAPIMYCIAWFCVFGGAGMRQYRQARELRVMGEKYFGDEDYFSAGDGKGCYDVPQEPVYVNGTLIFENNLVGVTPVCGFDIPSYAPYNLLYSFSFPKTFDGPGYGPILTVLFIIGLSIYFATSSDSGSLVVDHLASNGRKDHHWLQRLFWAVTEGAVATALLAAGGSKALDAVQAASIIGGLPFAVMLFYIMQTIYLLGSHSLEHPYSYEFDAHQMSHYRKEFAFPIYGGFFNVVEYVFSGGNVNEKRVEKGMDNVTSAQLGEFVKAIVFPTGALYKIISAAYPRNGKKNLLTVAAYTAFYYGFLALFAAYGSQTGILPWGWALFFMAGVLLTTVRLSFRERYSIRSNIVGDWIASTWIWPQVLAQMVLECEQLGLPSDNNNDKYED